MNALFPDGLYGIIYDCDGVMIDSAAGNRHLYNLILAELGLPPVTDQQVKYAFQATFQQALRYLVPEEKHHLIDAACRKAVDYDRDIVPKIKLMPHYREFIEKAHERGLRQAIDTNRTDFGIEKIIKHFKLPDYFEPVINSTNVEKPKPFPEGVDEIRAAWDCKPAQMLFVGDSPDDRAAAKGGGAVFAAFGPGDLTGEIKVADWPSLARILWGEQ